MKKTAKKLISIMLAVMLMVSTFVMAPVSASSAVIDAQIKTLDFSVTCIEPANGSDLGTVKAHFLTATSAGTAPAYLFLPAKADVNNLKVHFTASSCTITPSGGSEVALTNGGTTDIFASGLNGAVSYSLKLGTISYNLLVYKSENIGTVYFNTESGNTDKIDYGTTNTNHTAFESGSIMVVDEKGKIDYNGTLEKIQGRGNGTWESGKTKLPYNIKLGISTSLLGMGKAKKWVLLANYGDNTLVKNQITYDFAKYLGIPYQVIGKPVDVYANGKYMGNYTLCEKVEIKSNRVNVNDSYEGLQLANGTTDAATGIVTPADFSTMSNVTTGGYDANGNTFSFDEGRLFLKKKNGHTVGTRKYSKYSNAQLNNPSDITGGYLYELEISKRWIEENAGFCAFNRQCWVLKSHDYASKAQVDYSYDLLYALGSSLYNNGNVQSSAAADYQNKRWSDLLDADSAVKYYWMQEFFMNMDSSTSSTYFNKDTDSVNTKLVAGPVWDMDNAFGYDASGSRWGHSYTNAEDWYAKNARIYRYDTEDSGTSSTSVPLNFYAALATNCADFWDMAQQQWFNEIYPATAILLGIKTDSTGTVKSIAEYVNTISASGVMDHIRYDKGAYDAASIISGMEGWVTKRNNFINKELGTIDIGSSTIYIDAVPRQKYTGSPVEPKVHIAHSISTGMVDLIEGVDYELSYENNIEIGKASINIKGLNRYETPNKTRVVNFNIGANSLEGGSFSIYEAAYIGDEIEPTVLDADGVQIKGGINYKWFADGVQVGTGSTYTVTESDAGKVITASAEGNGTQITGSLNSNECRVASVVRPSGAVKNIATFSYKYGDNGLSLQGSKTKGYNATAGVQKDTAKLYASVNGISNDNLEWSGQDSFLRTDGTSGQQPVMKPSANTPWQEYPYFDIAFSTKDYSDVTFSCDIGATAKGAKYYALMYSVNGGEFEYLYNENPVDEFDYLAYEIDVLDKKAMKTAFDLTLPQECENAESVVVRIAVDDIFTVEGADTLFTSTNTNGKIAINNIYVNGVKANNVTGLDAPVIETSAEKLYADDKIVIEDTNAGSDVYYTLTDENGDVTAPAKYEGAFAPFGIVSSAQLTVTAWCESGIYKSAEVSRLYSFAGDAIARFEYQTYSEEVVNAAVPSNGGAYGKSSVMKTVADGQTQLVPLYNADNKAFAVSPDDGLKWTAESGFYFELCTIGYNNIIFSCDAYTTQQGPKSMSLQVSTDGINWTTIQSNKALPANAALESYFEAAEISGIENIGKAYIRLVTEENSTLGGTALHNNLSKGNVYINNIIIGGTQDGSLRMPYTNKSTDYYGLTGVIKYTSPDNAPMQYTVTNSDGTVVSSGAYPNGGIQLASMPDFTTHGKSAYTVSVWAGDDDDQSPKNTRKFFYKGDLVAEFDYGSNKFASAISADGLSLAATAGTGTLSMYPNGKNALALDYASSYGVKAAATPANPWVTDTSLDNPAGKGFWLIEASTLGYEELTMSLEQITSNKGPRDWGIAYSLDGVNYTYLENSNARAIEGQKTIETYSNIKLPSELADKEKVYIKVFINGGENLAGYELADPVESLGKGNTGINNIQICGISPKVAVTLNTIVMDNPAAQSGTMALPGVSVYLDDTLIGTTNELGSISFSADGGTHKLYLDNGSFCRELTLIAANDGTAVVAMIALDMNKDGYVNTRDYTRIYSLSDVQIKEYYQSVFQSFLNVNQNTFEYSSLSVKV